MKCKECNGKGSVLLREIKSEVFPIQRDYGKCEACNGTGQDNKEYSEWESIKKVIREYRDYLLVKKKRNFISMEDYNKEYSFTVGFLVYAKEQLDLTKL